MDKLIAAIAAANTIAIIRLIFLNKCMERNFQAEIRDIKENNKRRYLDTISTIFDIKGKINNKVKNAELSLRGNLIMLQDDLQKLNINNTYLNPKDKQIVFVTVNENDEVIKVE